MDLSIILVNYKSPQLVLDCLKSIYEQTSKITFEIYVVDNASEDNSNEIILKKYPQVKWIQMDYNAGFARGNNAAIKVANGELILLLNTDTIVLENALEKAVALFKKEENIAACGVQLLNIDGSNQISGAHFVKGGLNLLLPLPYLGKLIRYLGYKLKTRVPSIINVKDKVAVDWAIGAFLLTSKIIIKKAGMLDEDFFMYAEEIEWCSRLRKYGGIYLYSEPKIIHLLGGSSIKLFETFEKNNSQILWNSKGGQIMLSNLIRVRKQYGLIWFLIHLFFLLITIPVFLVGIIFNKITGFYRNTYSFSNFYGYLKNTTTICKYVFKIIINKPYFYKLK